MERHSRVDAHRRQQQRECAETTHQLDGRIAAIEVPLYQRQQRRRPYTLNPWVLKGDRRGDGLGNPGIVAPRANRIARAIRAGLRHGKEDLRNRFAVHATLPRIARNADDFPYPISVYGYGDYHGDGNNAAGLANLHVRCIDP